MDFCSSEPRYAYLAENYVQRSLIRASGGWLLLAGMEKPDLWSYLRNVDEDEKHLVDDFLAAKTTIEQSGICVSPNASGEGDGVAIAVREQGRTVAAVGVISSHEIIVEHRENIVDVLQRSAQKWSQRATPV